MSKEDLLICRCEEVTLAQIREAIAMGATSIKAVKKITRAGMGDCQGRTCHRRIAAILSQELQQPIEQLEEDLVRFPIMPVSLELLRDVQQEESSKAKEVGK